MLLQCYYWPVKDCLVMARYMKVKIGRTGRKRANLGKSIFGWKRQVNGAEFDILLQLDVARLGQRQWETSQIVGKMAGRARKKKCKHGDS